MSKEEDDFSSLPLTDRLAHKKWNVRLGAYKELTNELATLDADHDAIKFSEYEGFMEKMVRDSNSAAQEQALQAIFAFVENSPHPTRTIEGIVPVVVEKCLSAAKPGTKKHSLELLMLYVEVDKPMPVIERIVEGFELKTPKAVAAAVKALTEIVKAFGTRRIDVKVIVKALGKGLGHKDKQVRAETQELVVELCRWVGSGLLATLGDINPVALKDLTEKVEKLAGEDKPRPTRYLRSERPEESSGGDQAPPTAASEGVASDSDDGVGQAGGDMDPWDLADPIDINDKVPDNFYTDIVSKKWKERKGAVDELHKALTETVRIADKPITMLVEQLAARIKDANIMVATVSLQCIELLAIKLRAPFAQHHTTVVPPMIEKLKERKPAFIELERSVLDAVFSTTSRDPMVFMQYFEEGVDHKNPQVRAECIRLLGRCLSKTPSVPAKANIKTMVDMGKKIADDGDAGAREAALEMLGVVDRLIGEKAFDVFLGDFDKIKLAKVREYCEKATISVKKSAPKPATKPKPTHAASKKVPSRPPQPPPVNTERQERTVADELGQTRDDGGEKPAEAGLGANLPPALRRKLEASAKVAAEKKAARQAKNSDGSVASAQPAAASPRPAIRPKPATTAAPQRSSATAAASATSVSDITIRYKYANEDALDDLIADQVPPDVPEMLKSVKWKERVEALDSLQSHLEAVDINDIEPELIVRQFAKKPGWKENNFQVNGRMYSILKWLSENCLAKFSPGCAALCIPALVDKLGDIKLKQPAADALVAFAERLSLKMVLGQALEPMAKQKSPKVLGDCLGFLDTVLLEFGIAGLPLKQILDFVKGSGLASSNGQVRQKAVTVMGTLRRFVGPPIASLVDDLNPQIKALVDAEFERVSGENPPVPTRRQQQPGVAQKGQGDGEGSSRSAPGKSAADPDTADDDAMDSLFPRVNITQKITPALLRMLNDANWKQRKAGLETLLAILEDAKHRISPEIPFDLMTALKNRLNDSNKNLIPAALSVLADLATSAGAGFKPMIQTVVLSTMLTLSDKKATVRQAAIKTLDAYVATCESALDGPIVHFAPQAFANDSPELRENLLGWLDAELSKRDKDALPDLSGFMPEIFSCLQDRNAKVRANAQKVLGKIVLSVGYEAVIEMCGTKLKGAAKQTVLPMIEKWRGLSCGKAKQSSSTTTAAASKQARAASPASTASIESSSRVITAAELVGKPIKSVVTAASTATTTTTTANLAASVTAGAMGGSLRRPIGPRRRLGADGGPPAAPRSDFGGSGSAAPVSAPTAGPAAQRGRLGPQRAVAAPRAGATSPQLSSAMQSDEPLPPIMNAHEKYKQMRARKDVAAVATRWQFSDQPRPELVNLLHAQTEGHLNNDIRGKLFSSGHYKDRDYLAGLSALDDVLSIPGYSEDRYGIPTAEMRSRYIAHSDLILKYISLRLYDSQTHTLSKCLDLLEHLLGVMEEVGNDDRYQQVIGLTDYEAHCILPHLIVQLGNGKEQIRSRVRRVIIGQMTHLYPVTKIFQMLLEHGLRASKNSRVRQEALDSMAYFVRERSAGLGLGGVCAMPAKTVPVIASAISDRDANVRNAALNCLVEISGNVPGGEGDLWRLIGRLPERERSMLEEKLRHNGSGSASVGSRSSSRMSGSIGGGGSVGRMASIRPPLAGGSSGLRPPSRTAGTLQRGGLGSLHPHRLPPTTGGNSADQYQSQYPTRSQAAASGGHPRPYNLDLDRLELPSYSSHVKPSLTTAPRTTSPSAVGPGIDEYHHQDQTSAPSPSEEQWIEGIIADLSGDDPRAVVDALDQLQQFLSEKSSDTQGLVVRHINDLLPAVRLQMRWAFATTTDPESASPLHATLNRLRKATVGTLIDVFKGDSRLGKHANEESVSQVLDELLRRLVDPVLTESTTSDAPLIEDALQLTKAMNSLVMRILENADRTTVYCTLVGMLENAMAMRIPTEGQTPTQRHHAKYGDLVMRCLWRISKHLRDEVTKSPKPALRYGELLPLTHRFFARLPDSEWRQREERKCLYGDLPKRTIKTINHAIATGLGGGDIWDYMSGVAAMVCAEDPSVLRRLGQLGQQRATRALSDSDWAGEVHDVLSESSETYAYIRHVLQDKFSPSVGQVEGILAGVSGLGLGSSSGSALRRGMPAFSSVMDSISSPAKGAGSVGGGPMGNISPLRSSNSNSTSTSNGGSRVRSPSMGITGAAKAHGSSVFTRPASLGSTAPAYHNVTTSSPYQPPRATSPLSNSRFAPTTTSAATSTTASVARTHDNLAMQLRALKEKISSTTSMSTRPASHRPLSVTENSLSRDFGLDYQPHLSTTTTSSMSRPLSMMISPNAPAGPPAATSSTSTSHSIDDLRVRLAQMRSALQRPSSNANNS